MILLVPAYAMFLLSAAPGGAHGWREMIRTRTMLLAAGAACAGACLYAWNLAGLWHSTTPPATASMAWRNFWFDVTKSDWRETMVLGVPGGMLPERARAYGFDLYQQFGWIAVPLALAGALQLMRRDVTRLALLGSAYVVNAVFAFSYNVGDSHVFWLPSHPMVALLAAPGISLVAELTRSRGAMACVVAVYAALHAYRDYPALDRSDDHRPAQALAALTSSLDEGNSLLLIDVNWQLQNGLSYYGQDTRPDIAYARMRDVLLYAPALVRDNVAIGRDVVLTEDARADIEASYGPLFTVAPDARVVASRLSDVADGLPAGTVYALCILKPTHEFALDRMDLDRTLERVTAGRMTSWTAAGDYSAIVGLVGEAPALVASSDRPFQRTVETRGVPIEVRMESWLAFDTIRRMGFGHVLASRHHALIVERGVSFVAIDGAGRPIRVAYSAGIFTPQARYLIKSLNVREPS